MIVLIEWILFVISSSCVLFFANRHCHVFTYSMILLCIKCVITKHFVLNQLTFSPVLLIFLLVFTSCGQTNYCHLGRIVCLKTSYVSRVTQWSASHFQSGALWGRIHIGWVSFRDVYSKCVKRNHNGYQLHSTAAEVKGDLGVVVTILLYSYTL